MKFSAVVIAIVAMLHICTGMTINIPKVNIQFFGYGACPSVSVKDHFDMSKFKGKWYEQERLAFAPLANQKCVSYDIEEDDNSGYDVTVRKTNTWFDYRTATFGTLKTVKGSSSPAKMEWRYWDILYYGIPYWVVDTDYSSYALVYSCQDYSYSGYGIHLINAWVLSRDKAPLNASVLQTLHSHLEGAGVDKKHIMKTKQDC